MYDDEWYSQEAVDGRIKMWWFTTVIRVCAFAIAVLIASWFLGVINL